MSTKPRPRLQTGAAKILGIKLDEPDRTAAYFPSDNPTAGSTNPPNPQASSTGFSLGHAAESYVETEPTVAEWASRFRPSQHGFVRFFANLFPFLKWVPNYNTTWLAPDLVAGVTVGTVVIPQSMAYAKLAGLAPEFGLYSSFMGVLVYWFFATSKDITIGPVAVMSVVTGNVIQRAQESIPDVPAHVVASALAVICGCIIFFLGLVRLGWLVDVISLTAISAFMTGSALNIAVGQVPKLMGLENVNSRGATYKILIDSLRQLGQSNLNAALGLTALTMLYLIRSACNWAARRYPAKAKSIFFVSTLRTSFVILLYTLIGWLVNRTRKDHPAFSILGKVPRGFKHAAVPTINIPILKAMAPDLPASVIVLLIEHISIAKSFGRVNNYTIDPSQELVAIGITNILGPFLGAYPATGSFSRTAIKSKAGVRTPFAGVITALVILLAIYALPAVFFYIPDSALSAVIIHAVLDLITPPATVYRFWRISPIEVPIFFAGVLVSVFSSIENGIYTTIVASMALFLFRVFKARGRFLGTVLIHSVVGQSQTSSGTQTAESTRAHSPLLLPSTSASFDHSRLDPMASVTVLKGAEHIVSTRTTFMPLDHDDGSNPSIVVMAPYPGIFIFRFSEGYNYPNANHYLDYMVARIFATTKRTTPLNYAKRGDRPWNNPGPRKGEAEDDGEYKPMLRAIILDFSTVNNVDITSVQHLIDVRNQLDRYTAPNVVDWHFAHISNRWTKRALAAAGFGLPSSTTISGDDVEGCRWKPIFSVAETASLTRPSSSRPPSSGRPFPPSSTLGGSQSFMTRPSTGRIDVEAGIASGTRPETPADGLSPIPSHTSESKSPDFQTAEIEKADSEYGEQTRSGPIRRVAVVHGINRPLFHLDLTSALQAAIANLEEQSVGVSSGVKL